MWPSQTAPVDWTSIWFFHFNPKFAILLRACNCAVAALRQESEVFSNRSPYAGSDDGEYEPLEDNDGNDDADDWLEGNDDVAGADYHDDDGSDYHAQCEQKWGEPETCDFCGLWR